MRTMILLVIAAAGILPATGRAQEGGAIACPSIESDSERLACYDRALRGPPRAPAATPAAPDATPAPAAAATPTPAAAGSAAVAGAAAATGAAAAAHAELPPQSTIGTAPRTSTRNANAPQPGAPPAVNPSANQPVGVVPIIVASARAMPGRGVEFTTDRGDVWLQTDTHQLNLPATPFNARIEPSTFGGYFLVPEKGLGIRVRHRE